MNDSATDPNHTRLGQPIVADPSWAEPAPPGAEQRDIERVILSGERIAVRIRTLGEAITRAYAPHVADSRLACVPSGGGFPGRATVTLAGAPPRYTPRPFA